MCGIAIYYDLSRDAGPASPARYSAVEGCLARMTHRGPDDAGIVQRGRAVLGQTRLAIMDVAGGRQPLADAASGRVVVGNGEIYNHGLLRDRFQDEFSFRTRSDNEVVLPAYAQLGRECVRVLDGMFAFGLSDGDGMFAARDPLGIKPLYYGHHQGGIMLASEMRALAGFVDEIAEFPPGHFYAPDAGMVPYYHVPGRVRTVSNPARAMTLIRETLDRAVRSHLMADVPVGAFLSGGLDSSLLALLARREVRELHTFAVGMAGSADLAAAARVAAFLGTTHHVCELTPDMMAEALDPIVLALESYDSALVRSAVPTWFVARLAAQTRTSDGNRIKVVLTGEGADELFAGYEYLRHLRGVPLERELARLLGSLHNLNLQRVDRMTMAHGLEARVPFLSTSLVEEVMRIDPLLKEAAAFGREKGLLRRAFEGELPPDILWRAKAEFAQGSSVSQCVADAAEARVSEREWARARAAGLPVASREELHYFRLLQEHLHTPLRAGTIGRWQGPVL